MTWQLPRYLQHLADRVPPDRRADLTDAELLARCQYAAELGALAKDVDRDLAYSYYQRVDAVLMAMTPRQLAADSAVLRKGMTATPNVGTAYGAALAELEQNNQAAVTEAHRIDQLRDELSTAREHGAAASAAATDAEMRLNRVLDEALPELDALAEKWITAATGVEATTRTEKSAVAAVQTLAGQLGEEPGVRRRSTASSVSGAAWSTRRTSHSGTRCEQPAPVEPRRSSLRSLRPSGTLRHSAAGTTYE